MRFNGSEIYDVIPNRFPLMILDYIDVEPGVKAVGEVLLKESHWFFECHYPNNPIFPGSLLIETMTQVFASTFLADSGINEIPMIYKIGEISIKESATIGDTIIFEANLKKFKRGIASGHCASYKVCGDGINRLITEFDIIDVIPSYINMVKSDE